MDELFNVSKLCAAVCGTLPFCCWELPAVLLLHPWQDKLEFRKCVKWLKEQKKKKQCVHYGKEKQMFLRLQEKATVSISVLPIELAIDRETVVVQRLSKVV